MLQLSPLQALLLRAGWCMVCTLCVWHVACEALCLWVHGVHHLRPHLSTHVSFDYPHVRVRPEDTTLQVTTELTGGTQFSTRGRAAVPPTLVTTGPVGGGEVGGGRGNLRVYPV